VRTFRSIAVAAVAGAVVVGLAAAPVQAKGPQSATIDGPGLADPIAVGDAGYTKLPGLTGVFGPLWDEPSVPLHDEPPTTELGPGYEVTWDLGAYVDEAGGSDGTPDLVVQTVYPYAAGRGPLVHTEAGQRFYAEETSGGWYYAHPALRDLLVDLGVPAGEVEELTAAEVPPADDDGGWRLPIGLVALGLAATSATTVGLVRRRVAVPAAVRWRRGRSGRGRT